MDKLIIAEKPSVALRIALSLGESGTKRNTLNGIGYFEAERGGDRLFIVAAVGHLFTLHQREKNNVLPIFDIEWIESYKINKHAYYTKKYLDTIEEIGKRCNFFINACDYDLEGTVIGSNILKKILNGQVNSEIVGENIRRMKFSTTTKTDLVNSYNEILPFDFNNLYAGETRHMLDWMWGINLSRALMHALFTIGTKRILSVGRVQGPTLAILAKRELEIKNFVPQPFWKLFLKFEGVVFENRKGSIFEKEKAQEALEKTRAANVIVNEVNVKEEMRAPFPPFDLTSLQVEASRVFKIDPSKTLSIAQSLYERSYISYPRTSSQKLPPTLNLKRVISELAKLQRYNEAAGYLMGRSRFRPHEGMKEDEAHPAIHPTGETPKKISADEERIYDLIVRRFLACFGEYAKIEDTEIILGAGDEAYIANGDIVKEKGWMVLYEPYYKHKELRLPKLEKGARVEKAEAYMSEGKTEPPRRYTKASLISLLEKKNLGTKATRAAIIDTLFDREYIKSYSIEVTGFGMSVYKALSQYCAEILDEELTTKLELDMDKIAHGNLREKEVIDEGKGMITTIINDFKKNEKGIGKALSEGLMDSERANVLGKCRKCEAGNLVIKRSRNRKQFVGCTNWPNCTNSYPLPQFAKIVPINKECGLCNTPKVKVFAKGKVFEMDLDPNCETKKNWRSKQEVKSGVAEIKPVTATQTKEDAGMQGLPVKKTEEIKKMPKKRKIPRRKGSRRGK